MKQRFKNRKFQEKKMTMHLKSGQGIITGNGNRSEGIAHCFDKGAVVDVIRIDEGKYVQCRDGRFYQWVSAHHIVIKK